ncbi:MAG: glycine betaine/proline transport system permease protein [Clostridiales bacterium]|jgi:glycine betaine/proline transport system permease protein|nr:glycine betaine/proline transport system permease protein [Clostridiales bacterium]MDN5298522.1 glycine betaine/proline transport system permease protein [Clostridiales bacterium]
MIRLPLGEYFEAFIDLLKDNFDPFFKGMKKGVLAIIDHIEDFLHFIPWWLLIILVAVLAWRLSGKKLGILSAVGLYIIYSIDLWSEMIDTLSLVFSATFLALVIGIPLGIWMAKNDMTERIVKPILDFMQTMPAFVYLIPSVIFFGLGKMPGAIATIIFAMPPVVRLTNLGIRQVPEDVVEAATSFGSTSGQMLLKVQIPLAMPTILAGVNQTIMLSLSMVVISAMIGARGLGEVVLSGVTQMQIGDGFEGGIAVVILAIVLDRITQAVGTRTNAKKTS